jgi:hypothetical protein
MVVVLTTTLGLVTAPRQAVMVEVPGTSGRYADLRRQAVRFFDAVRRSDKAALAGLALAETREVVRRDLADPRSRLSRILLTGSRAMRGRFKHVRAPRVVLLRHPDLVGVGDGTTVCFSDSRQEFRTPASMTELPAVETNRAEMCVFFVHADRRWNVTYDFAYPD